MCDCLKNGTEKIKNHIENNLKKTDPGFIEIVSARYKHLCFCLSGNSDAPINIPFEVIYKRKLKNGKIKDKKEEIGMLPSFCPFCGEKYKKAEM